MITSQGRRLGCLYIICYKPCFCMNPLQYCQRPARQCGGLPSICLTMRQASGHAFGPDTALPCVHTACWQTLVQVPRAACLEDVKQ